MKKSRTYTATRILTIVGGAVLGAWLMSADRMGARAFVVLVSISSVVSVVLSMELLERVPFISRWSGFTKHIEMISRGRWPRRPYERTTDWHNRVVEAHRELCDAEWAFVEAAQREGHRIGTGRVEQWLLPPSHPAAIRLAKARNEPVVITKQAPYRGAVV